MKDHYKRHINIMMNGDLKQSNIRLHIWIKQAKQEGPAVKSDFVRERQGNTVQETVQSQQLQPPQQIELHNVQPKNVRLLFKEYQLQNTRSRPLIKTATIKKVGKKPWSWKL